MKYIFNNKNIRYGIFILVSLLMYGLASKLTIVLTHSINATIMWKEGGMGEKGDYVNYTLDPQDVDNNIIVVTKIVTCVEGDFLNTRNSEYYCNDQFIGVAKAKGRKGQKLTQFRWNGVVPPNKVFLSGEHKDSFDSRYWGFAELSKTTKVIKLL